MKLSKLIALLLVLAMVLALAACGSTSTTESTSSTESESSESTTTESEEADTAESEEAEPAESEEADAAESEEAESTEAEAETEEESEQEFAESPTYSLRMSCEASEGQWLAEMLQDYADDVYEATYGQVQIELYLGNSLGSSDDIYSMFTSGAIDMMHAGVAHAGNFPVTNFVQTPFAVTSPEMAEYVMSTLADEGMLAEFTDNMHVIAYMPTLMQEFMFVDREVTSFDDLSGMVIRASSTPLVSCVEAVGSTPTTIAITDLYMSLSQGVADGTITSVDAAEVFSLQDVCKYLLDMPICTGMNYVAINNTVWNSLPADIQEAMDEVGATYQEKYLELNAQAGEDCIATMTEGGLTVLEPSDELVEACKEATSGMMDELIENLNAEGLDGATIVARAQQAVADYEAQ